MKIKIIILLTIVALALPLMAAPPNNLLLSKPNKPTNVDNTVFIDANKILMIVTNHGNFGRDLAGLFGYDYGTFFPFTDTASISNGSNKLSPYYAGGLWMGAKVRDTLRVVIAEYSDEYVPGPMADHTFAPDAPEYRVYKLYKDSLANNPNRDYTEYLQYAIHQGAPFKVVDGDTVPDMIGDQMCWSVFSDADPAQHIHPAGSTAPLGVEVRNTTFAFNREDPLANIVFIKLQVYNKGVDTLKDCYLSIWSDPDLGGSGDDLVGCDTIRGIGFIYNVNNADQYYGSTPPALGIDFLQGPLDSTGDLADTAKMWGKLWPGYRNMMMKSFNKYINGTDPDSKEQVYNYMQGLERDGGPYINPITNDSTPFSFSGDPVARTGDLDGAPADRRMMMTTGPITFKPGDSTEILAAMVVGRGGDRLSSISVMKYFDQFAQTAYDLDFALPKPPAAPVVTAAKLEGELTLAWTDTSEVDPGDYPFQGYSVYQGVSSSGPWTLIANYDVIDGAAKILDDVLDPLTGVLEFRGVKFGTDNGIQRYFIVDQDYLLGGKLNNLTKYYFRVEAYSFYDIKTPRTLTSSNRSLIVVIPQAQPAGYTLQTSAGDSITTNHAKGVSDGSVKPVAVDPESLTGHTYRVVFVDTMIINPSGETTAVAWNLEDVTTGERLLSYQTNQSGDEDYRVLDGFVVKVSGPAVGFKAMQVVANGNGPLDPPAAGAFGFQDFPTGAVDEDGALINPDENQQVGDGLWGFHTADNGGSCGGGTRGSYNAFLSRATRDGGNFKEIGSYDFEMRFTGETSVPDVEGSYAFEAFIDDYSAFWVPFELWNIGIGTPDDLADDYKMVPWIIDDGEDNTYNLESWGCILDEVFGGDGEHSASGGNNDPFTDWVYWCRPDNESPGDAGYLAAETEMKAGTYDGSREHEVLARSVLVNWNGGVTPPFTQNLPETGTIFRLTTNKPNSTADTFTFVAPAREFAAKASDLDKIKAVPNPFYLYGGYDPSPGSYQLNFHHLPNACTITIYNLAGDYIRKIEKNDPSTAIAGWDLLTERGLPVASGIYIYVVDAPGFGTKVGKLAVFTQAEVLDLF